jgi:thiamine pyrophosphate-dependent acetolactate synthase large subunit-like protein
MTCGELAVARRHNLPIPFVVLDDRWLSLIKVKQERRGMDLYATELLPDEYPQPPAHYFGVPAVGVRTPEDLEHELAKALSANGPTVIEAIVDPAHYSDTVYD